MVNRELVWDYNKMLSEISGKDYLQCIIAIGAAPTMKEVKPSNILTFKGRKQVYRLWNMYKDEICNEIGLDYFQLIDRENSVTVMFYKSTVLKRHINQKQNMQFLNRIGYNEKLILSEQLSLLKERFSYQCPHEMGIFLGIPVEDVCSFLEHNGKNCLFCRYWKVYHNPDKAQKMFEEFDMAKVYVINELLEKHNAA